MPELVSAATAVALCGYGALRQLSSPGTALSGEAAARARGAIELVVGYQKSFALSGARSEVLSSLVDLAEEHAIDGWDGAEAPALSDATIDNVRAFILALPSWVPDPEFAMDPDNGAVSVEWHGGYRRLFSVSVGESSRLAYAGLDGTESVHGVARFDGQTIPSFLVSCIEAVLA